METIPFHNNEFPHFFQSVTLDNEIYILNFDWNVRGEFWNMAINNVANEPIVSGIKLVLNYELIRRFGKEELPPGYLIAIDVTEKMEKIGRNDMDDLVFLTYYTEDEVAAL